MPFDIDDVTCAFTLNACARLTVDALCCIPCCCCCGGCCGRYKPCVAGAFPDDDVFGDGSERFMETCMVQTYAGFLMPFTCCGCFWAACGLATPCARCVVGCVLDQDEKSKKSATPSATIKANVEIVPVAQTMKK